mgnify:CR=1 FL=1
MDMAMLKKSLCTVVLCTSDTYTLEETDKNATLKNVYMCDIPNGSLIVKMDKIRFNNFLKDQKVWGFNKHSDFLIITDDKLVFIELKSRTEVGKELRNECVQKFASDKCTVNYADNIFKEILAKNPFFASREPHFVLLYQAPSILKHPTTLGAEFPNLTPDTFRQIPVQNNGTISFNKTI